MRTCRFSPSVCALIASLVVDAGAHSVKSQMVGVPRPAEAVTPPHASETGLRDVRVLMATKVKRVRVRADSPIYLLNEDGVRVGVIDAGSWHLVAYHSSEEVRLSGQDRSLPIGMETDQGVTIGVSTFRGGAWSGTRHYPGRLEFRSNRGGVDVINHVDLERYVACVVGNEVWPTFQTESYRAQAVVSRTYVLYQMKRNPTSRVDVSATQGSQVYRGVRDDVVGRRATEAARFTRGIVLTYPRRGKDDLFCTYFSAACGGVSQSAGIFGKEGDIPPLRGGVRCDYCSIAPPGNYRWGPVTLALSDLEARLVSRYSKMKTLGHIRSVEVVDRNQFGRPMRLRVHGTALKSQELTAERFRIAIGFDTLKSTDFQLESGNRKVTFKNGRGFGHGLGLCQWGMEGQARLGRRAGEILRFYFPGASLTRVY